MQWHAGKWCILIGKLKGKCRKEIFVRMKENPSQLSIKLQFLGPEHTWNNREKLYLNWCCLRSAKPGASNFLTYLVISKLLDVLGQMFGRFQSKKDSHFQFLWGWSLLHASHFSSVELKHAAPSRWASSNVTYLCLQEWIAALLLSSIAAGLNQY